MALSFRKSSPRGSVGLDVDGGYLAAVSTVDGRIDRAVSSELPPGLMRDGDVVDSVGLATAVKTFFRDNALPKNVRLGVANQQIAVRHMELPKIADEGELAAAVRFQAGDAIAMPLEEAALDFQVVGETVSPEGATRMKLVVVAARQEMIARLVDAVREAGLRPEGIDLDAFALVRALAPQADPSGDARVYCHLGGVTNLAVAIGPTCLFTRTLATLVTTDGSEVVASEASASAESGPDPFRPIAAEAEEPAAEPVPEVSSVEAAALAAFEAAASKQGEAAEPPAPEIPSDPQVDALGEEIRLSIDFYMAQAEAQPATGVVLSGPGAHREGIAERLEQAIGLPVELAAPLGRLDASGVPAGDDEFRYTIAAGLALGEGP